MNERTKKAFDAVAQALLAEYAEHGRAMSALCTTAEALGLRLNGRAVPVSPPSPSKQGKGGQQAAPKLVDVVMAAVEDGPAPMRRIIAFVQKRRPGTTRNAVYSASKDLRASGKLALAGLRGDARYYAVGKE